MKNHSTIFSQSSRWNIISNYVKQAKHSKLQQNFSYSSHFLLALGIKCQQISTVWLSETKAFYIPSQMQSVDTLYQTKFHESREKETDNLMAGRDHNQLQSSWNVYLSNEGRWAIYMFKIRDPKVGEGERKKRNSSINKGRRPSWIRSNLKFLCQKSIHWRPVSKINSFSEETLKWARRKHSFAPTRTNPLTTGMLLLKRSWFTGIWPGWWAKERKERSAGEKPRIPLAWGGTR